MNDEIIYKMLYEKTKTELNNQYKNNINKHANTMVIFEMCVLEEK